MKTRFIISLQINTAAYSINIRPRVEASQKRAQEKKITLYKHTIQNFKELDHKQKFNESATI